MSPKKISNRAFIKSLLCSSEMTELLGHFMGIAHLWCNDCVLVLQMRTDTHHSDSNLQGKSTAKSSAQSSCGEQGLEVGSRRQSRAGTVSTVEDVDDWEISSAELQICRHPDGRPVELGSGAFGKASSRPRETSLGAFLPCA